MSTQPADPVERLGECLSAAIIGAYPALAPAVDPMLKACNQPEHGDFQCNAAMSLGKRLGVSPREVAKAIVAASHSTSLADVAEPLSEQNIAGPGFINIRLKAAALQAALVAINTPDLGLPKSAAPETVVVDLMGVNLAKQMHVGHLRSPIIGDALAKAFERLGHRVIRQNHVGDWGLPIAMVTAHIIRQLSTGTTRLDSLTLDELDTAYKAAQAECSRDLAGLEACRKYGLGPKATAECEAQVESATERLLEARQTLLKLQASDPATLHVWNVIQDVTMRICLSACARLGVNVTAAHSAGESSYANELTPLVEDLITRGVAEPDQGALIVRLDAPQWGAIAEPCLVRKTDGGYLYATTDIAAVRRRVQKMGAHRLVYSIDARQSLHLKQMFGASKKAGYTLHPTSGTHVVMQHAAFGSVLGEDGRPLKTRSGESIKLADLLDETFSRALASVRARNPDMDEAQLVTIAEGIGMAALKYADLCNDRARDYVFSFDRMLAFEGNTGPYLLYALVRVKNMFRKAAEQGLGEAWKSAQPSVTAPAEKNLALALLRYPLILRAVTESLEPHRLCQYLFELASLFSSFYDQCPVLASDGPTRDARLALSALVGRVLEDGLTTLGIPTVERM